MSNQTSEPPTPENEPLTATTVTTTPTSPTSPTEDTWDNATDTTSLKGKFSNNFYRLFNFQIK